MQKTRSEILWEIAIPLSEGWLPHIDYTAMMAYYMAANNEAIFKSNLSKHTDDGMKVSSLDYWIAQNDFKKAKYNAVASFCELIVKEEILIFGVAVSPRRKEYPQSIHPAYITRNSVNFDIDEILFENRHFINVRIVWKKGLATTISSTLSGPISLEHRAIEIIAKCEIEIADFWQLSIQQQCQKMHDMQKPNGLPELAISDASLRRYLRNYKARKDNANN